MSLNNSGSVGPSEVLRVAVTGDVHLEEDKFFLDTKRCLEWFVYDAIDQRVSLFVINGDLTTYKATIRERNCWMDMLVEMANHAPVVLVAGNHGKELDGDLYVYGRARAKHRIYLCTEPEFLELDEFQVAVYPYPRKEQLAGWEAGPSLSDAFAEQLGSFARTFERDRSNRYRLFFGHFGVAGARVSKGQPLIGRCAEFPLDPLRSLPVHYAGLSHVHLRQQLAPRVWYCGTLSRCDFSEAEEEKGYHLLHLQRPDLQSDLSDTRIEFRPSPARNMHEVHVRYENGELRLPANVDPSKLKDARVKVVVSMPAGVPAELGREAQQRLRDQLAAAGTAELRMKVEREAEREAVTLPLLQAHSVEDKLRAYWKIKPAPDLDVQQRLLSKLATLEAESIAT